MKKLTAMSGKTSNNSKTANRTEYYNIPFFKSMEIWNKISDVEFKFQKFDDILEYPQVDYMICYRALNNIHVNSCDGWYTA